VTTGASACQGWAAVAALLTVGMRRRSLSEVVFQLDSNFKSIIDVQFCRLVLSLIQLFFPRSFLPNGFLVHLGKAIEAFRLVNVEQP